MSEAVSEAVRLTAAHSPYDGRRLLWFLGLHAVPGLESWDGEEYARALRLPSGPGVVRLRVVQGAAKAGHDAGQAGYDAELRLTDAADRPVALAQLRHLLDLDGDPGPAERAFGRDPLLAPLVATRPGLRAPGSVDHVETLVRTVVGQQVSLAGARSVTGQVVAAHGRPLPVSLTANTAVAQAFPTPEVLAAMDPATLPMPRARGRTVVAVAAAVVERGEGLVDGSAASAPALLALPGVGPWTAAYQALRAGRDPDVFLPTDLAVRRAFESHGLPGKPAPARAHAQAWAPHRTLALMHLWVDLLERRAAGLTR